MNPAFAAAVLGAIALAGCGSSKSPAASNPAPTPTPTPAPAATPQAFSCPLAAMPRSRYVKAVVEAIHAQGVCAVEEFEEIAVKTSNDFNEQYNIWVSTGGYIRKGPGAYITTRFPAQF